MYFEFIFICNIRMSFIEDYEVIRHIGKGSFSNVYLCKYESPLITDEDELFIIKEININNLVKSYISKSSGGTIRCVNKNKDKKNIDVNITPYTNEDELINTEQEYYFKRLEELIDSEIEILSNMEHPNIIKFYGYTKRDGIYYLRMEYCNGGDVYDFLKGNVTSLFANVKSLSKIVLKNFKPMIPDAFHKVWKNGINTNDYYLKLCGSGGGGFILGFAKDFEKAKASLKEYPLEVVYHF